MPFWMVVCAFILLVIATGVNDNQNDQMLHRFEARCADMGGITLKGVGHGSLNWVGCYKGLTEVYNEE